MDKDFIPTQEQLQYFDQDLMEYLQEAGIIQETQLSTINSIDWYDWDEDPRWFIHVSLYNENGKKEGYVEVDMWGGADTCIYIDKVQIAGHGYPCASKRIVEWDYEIDEWIIKE